MDGDGCTGRLGAGCDHHAFHEDAKPGDLSLQLGTRRFSSSKKLWTTKRCPPTPCSKVLITSRRSSSCETEYRVCLGTTAVLYPDRWSPRVRGAQRQDLGARQGSDPDLDRNRDHRVPNGSDSKRAPRRCPGPRPYHSTTSAFQATSARSSRPPMRPPGNHATASEASLSRGAGGLLQTRPNRRTLQSPGRPCLLMVCQAS